MVESGWRAQPHIALPAARQTDAGAAGELVLADALAVDEPSPPPPPSPQHPRHHLHRRSHRVKGLPRRLLLHHRRRAPSLPHRLHLPLTHHLHRRASISTYAATRPPQVLPPPAVPPWPREDGLLPNHRRHHRHRRRRPLRTRRPPLTAAAGLPSPPPDPLPASPHRRLDLGLRRGRLHGRWHELRSPRRHPDRWSLGAFTTLCSTDNGWTAAGRSGRRRPSDVLRRARSVPPARSSARWVVHFTTSGGGALGWRSRRPDLDLAPARRATRGFLCGAHAQRRLDRLARGCGCRRLDIHGEAALPPAPHRWRHRRRGLARGQRRLPPGPGHAVGAARLRSTTRAAGEEVIRDAERRPARATSPSR